MPLTTRDPISRRLYDVLSGKEARLSKEDRQANLEILRETKPGLQDYWRHQ